MPSSIWCNNSHPKSSSPLLINSWLVVHISGWDCSQETYALANLVQRETPWTCQVDQCSFQTGSRDRQVSNTEASKRNSRCCENVGSQPHRAFVESSKLENRLGISNQQFERTTHWSNSSSKQQWLHTACTC